MTRPFVVDVFKDRTGQAAIYVLVDGDYRFLLDDAAVQFVELVSKSKEPLICFDSRRLVLDFPKLKGCNVHDVHLMYGGEKSLFRLGRQVLGDADVADLKLHDQKLAIHIKACRTAKMNMTAHSILQLLPTKLILDLCALRAAATKALWSKLDKDRLAEYGNGVWELTRELYEIENVGVKVDLGLVEKSLKQSHTIPIDRFLAHVKNENVEGYVYSLFSAVGSKTDRLKVEGGFPSMSIPHGLPRETVVSRFEGGLIYAFDFNAIDYRCMISSVQDENFKAKYRGQPDFHSTTASFLFGDSVDALRRDIVKQITYVFLYGGSEETLAQKTGLSVEKIRQVLECLNRRMAPLVDFKRELVAVARRNGFVTLPDGKILTFDPADHDGKILGLYAQTYSSRMFRKSLISTKRLTRDWKSKVIFTVHDELVMDFHPDEFSRDDEVRSAMEEATGEHRFVVKIGKGKTYAAATD